MNRRIFTRACVSCLGIALMPPIFTSCQSIYYTTGALEDNGVAVLKSAFNYLKKDKPMTRAYIIVKHEKLAFPIYVYRFSDDEYSALLMKCTHQGNELSAAGDHLHCSAHGSEFNNMGVVAQGPAEKNLRAFKVTSEGDKLLIDLRS